MLEKLENLKANLRSVIHGKDEVIDLMLKAFFAEGNILMDDVPGVGKTTLAKALSKSIDGVFHRVQFTPDLLPSDIVGSLIYNPKEADFFFRRGPIFSNVMLADEINRASPRTQSALLEAMNESQVTVEGETHTLHRPFLVVATQNPVEYHGTYPLPEAQLDRFAVCLTLGYPDEEKELEVLSSRKKSDPIASLSPVINLEEIVSIQDKVKEVELEDSVARYILKIIRATREDERVVLGASPRAFLALTRCSQANAYFQDRNFVTPDDVKLLATPVLAHRLVLDNKAKYSGTKQSDVIQTITDRIAVPV